VLRAAARDTAIYGASSLLVRGLALLLLPFYTRVLTTEQYGLVDLATVFSTLVLLTVALEVSQGVARLFHDAEDRDGQVAYASTALWFSVGMYGLFTLLGLALAPAVAELVFESRDRVGLARIVVVSAAISGVFNLVLNNLRWRLQPMAFAAGSLTFALVSIAVTVALVLGAQIGVAGVLLGQLIGSAAGLVLCWVLSRDLYAARFDGARLREMLAFSLPLVPSSIGVFVTLYIDRVAIKELMTIDDVGLFGLGFRIASIVSLLVLAVQLAITPLVYARYREPGTPAAIARALRYFAGFAIVVAAALGVFAPEIVALISAPEYAGGAAVVPVLAPALLLAGAYVFAPGLAIAKRSGLQAGITIAGAVLNTVLNFALIPRLGIVGAGTATLISAIAVFAAYMAVSQRLYPVPHLWGPLGIAGAVAAAVLAIGSQVELSPELTLIVKVALLLVTVAVVVALRLIDPVDVHRVRRSVARRAGLSSR
jgi:O-antigen/teichoic acid export membrane protein